ncbi:GrpB family protein [Brevibacillus centrosporus]|uniref:GrpB domain, predicted nucleotidyltransferase, UPF0157 family n=1 Tax=Brevibacillus centrosporus TaxID=54910 RepID=A0A1I3WKX4_9BACL|nr:GrpB family protein [Brevibacillus centrosporus]MED4907449.1 GrpB family protein [Brevibacillus centrosporus]SFK07106.1 GrpB domain, predicted nucleotidyltransferase, UPF0157 family [Brevibacillus centrosporus]
MGSRIVIVEYEPEWVLLFEELRTFILPVVRDIIVSIEHVGSTSVPGLAAKPIIDIDVVVRTQEGVLSAIQGLASLGYVHEGDLGVSGREAFIPPSDVKWHHLYVCTYDNAEYKRHILFRDYLRSHPEEAKKYGELKLELAQKYVNDRIAYTEAKGQFVNRVLNRVINESTQG